MSCRRSDLGGRSVARVWNEALLNAIRRDVPAPTVHARNLFHLSAAMWDAWAAYHLSAAGYLVREKQREGDVDEAISYAAYRILLHRYSLAAGLEETFDELTATMEALCYPVDVVGTEGDSAAALGNRIAAAVIAHGREDGSLEQLRYADPGYRPVNEPLVVAEPGARMRDPARWQPLALDRQVAQNGLPIPAKVQTFIGSHWGHVDAFALPSGGGGLPLDPGPPPEDLGRAAVEVVRYSSRLDGDYGRAIAEFWADGPDSETPPGHWNTIANAVSDELAPRGRLEWDVKLYFALNGALHDAAIAAWGAKRHYDSSRPISLIRHLGARGELPLVPGLVERRGGTTLVRAWRGPGAGIGWIRAVDWLPYQRPTFVTPAFAGYVSGHSTFSRAAAEVLTALTGSPAFPGGPLKWRIRKGSFAHEPGPARDIVLRWSTYRDAAEEAGISRLYGGIHISADHYAGRKLGALCGKGAWALARRYFAGTA